MIRDSADFREKKGDLLPNLSFLPKFISNWLDPSLLSCSFKINNF
jgi:hypothetical protein